MPTILPPEWDAMSAKEQTIWYLASLIDRIEGMTAELVASTSRLNSAAPTTITEEVRDTNSATPICSDLAIDIPVTASTSTPAHVQDPSPKSSPDGMRRVAVAGTDEYELVAATPDIAIKLAVLPGVSSSTTKGKEVVRVASSDCIARAPVTCSTYCSNQFIGSPRSLLPVASMAPATDALHPAGDRDSILRVPLTMEDLLVLSQAPPMVPVANLMQLSVNHELEVSKSTVRSRFCLPERPMLSLMVSPLPTHKWLLIWPRSCLLFLADHIAEGREIRPIPWPSFPIGVSYQGSPCPCYGLSPHGAQLQPGRPPDQAPSDISGLTELEFIYVCAWSQDLGDQRTFSAIQFSSENYIRSMVQEIPYVWWPPDHQFRMEKELQAWFPPTQHATVVVHLFQSVKNPGTWSAGLSSQYDLQLSQFKQTQYSPDRAPYNAEVQSTRSRLQNAIQLRSLDIFAGFSLAGLEGISCHGTFAIHIAYLIPCMSTPCPWPSFVCFHEGAQLRYTWPNIPYVMHHFAGTLNSPTESLRCRQGVHLKLHDISFQFRPHECPWFSSRLVMFLFGGDNYFQVCDCEPIPTDKPFSCFQGEHADTHIGELGTWYPPDGATNNAEVQNTRKHLRKSIQHWSFGTYALFARISCHENFAMHAGCLFSWNLQPWPSWGFTSCASTRADARMCSRISGTNCGATQAVPGLLNLSLVAWSRTQRLSTGSKQKPCTARENYWAIVLPSLNCLFENCIRLLPGQQRLSELCACSFTTAPKLQYHCLATMAAHLFHSRQKTGALSTKLSSSIFIQLMQLGQHELGCCIIFLVQSSYDICAQDVQLRFGFSQKNVQPKLQYFACDCRAVCVQSELPKTVLPDKVYSSVTNLCWPATTSAPDLGLVEYLEDLFLVIDEQSRKWDTTRNLVCKTHEHWNLSKHHILEHTTVCSISMGDKLQRKIQLMSLSVHQQLLRRWKFKWSGHTVSGSRQITRVVYSYEFRSNSVLFATASSATRLAFLQIDTWNDYLLSSNVAIPMLCAVFYGQKTVMLCSWVATLVQQHISKIFHGLPSSSSSSKSELLVRDVCGAMSHELVIYKYHQLDITDSQIAKYIGWRSLFDLHSDYLLTCAIDLLGSDMSIDQLGTYWDPGEVTLSLLLEFTRRAVPQGGRGIIIVAVVFAQGYADHEYHLGFDRGCTDRGYVLDTFDWVSFSHNNYFSLVQVYPDSNQGQQHLV